MSGEGFPAESPPGVTIDVVKEMGWLNREQADAVRAEVRRLRSELEAARGALTEVQWGGEWARGIGEEVEQTCPGCGRRRSAGHAEACIVARALSSAGGGDAGKGETT